MSPEGRPQKPAKAPTGLAPSGKALWREVTGEYTLRPDELEVLESACRLADRIDQLEAALAADDLIVAGSRGQPAVNPLVPEIRMTHDLVARLLGRLALPDDGDRSAARGQRRSVSARELARARWGGG